MPLQDIGDSGEKSVIMSIARVYHIKIDSQDLDECGADETKCWTGELDFTKVLKSICTKRLVVKLGVGCVKNSLSAGFTQPRDLK